MIKARHVWDDTVERLQERAADAENENESAEMGWCYDLVEEIDRQVRGQPEDRVEVDLTQLAVAMALGDWE